MPNRLDAVAAHSAAGTLPRAIEVKAIEDCTVDGSTHSISTPPQSGGVSSPGASARAVSPSSGEQQKGAAQDDRVQSPMPRTRQRRLGRQPRALQEEHQGDHGHAGIARDNSGPPVHRQRGGQRHHTEDGGDVGVDGET